MCVQLIGRPRYQAMGMHLGHFYTEDELQVVAGASFDPGVVFLHSLLSGVRSTSWTMFSQICRGPECPGFLSFRGAPHGGGEGKLSRIIARHVLQDLWT